MMKTSLAKFFLAFALVVGVTTARAASTNLPTIFPISDSDPVTVRDYSLAWGYSTNVVHFPPSGLTNDTPEVTFTLPAGDYFISAYTEITNCRSKIPSHFSVEPTLIWGAAPAICCLERNLEEGCGTEPPLHRVYGMACGTGVPCCLGTGKNYEWSEGTFLVEQRNGSTDGTPWEYYAMKSFRSATDAASHNFAPVNLETNTNFRLKIFISNVDSQTSVAGRSRFLIWQVGGN